MQDQIATTWTADYLQRLIANDSVDFLQWRKQQLQVFLQQGFPDRHCEEWKYTNVNAIARQDFQLLENQNTAEINVDEYLLPNSIAMVFINGRFQSELSKTKDLPNGVIFTNTKTLLKDKNKYLDYFKNDKAKLSVFASLNAALVTDGLFLLIPKDLVINQPIHMLSLTTDESFIMTHPRHVVIAEEGSQVSIFEEYIGLANTKYFNNVVTNIFANRQTQVNHYKLQRESKNSFHIANIAIEQQQDSRVRTFHFATGAQLARDNLTFALRAEGCESELMGFYYLEEKQHIDNHTRIDHLVPHCYSKQRYHGVMRDQARGVFNGKVVVHPNANQTVAKQTNNNLLLTKTAEIDTKPELEIYADDVQCSHGATVGQLDENALFYLRSRGINLENAQHILTCAFANELLQQMPTSVVAEKIKKHIVNCLANNSCQGGCNHE